MIRAFRAGIVVFILGWMPLQAQEKAPDSGPQYSEEFKKTYSEAVDAFNRNNFDASMAKLDDAEKLQPGVNQTLNLRGALFVRMKKLDEAAAVFKKLTELDPKDPIPVFNMGEVFFLQKNYAEAKKSFQKFLAMPDNSQNALGLYKVFLCDLLLGNSADVQKTVDALRPNISNPFYYFANAAVAFKKDSKEEGRSYVQSAFGIYAGGLNAAFADSFIELGWLTQEDVGQIGAMDAASLNSLSKPAAEAPNLNAAPSGPSLDSMLPGLEKESDKDKEKKKQ